MREREQERRDDTVAPPPAPLPPPRSARCSTTTTRTTRPSPRRDVVKRRPTRSDGSRQRQPSAKSSLFLPRGLRTGYLWVGLVATGFSLVISGGGAATTAAAFVRWSSPPPTQTQWTHLPPIDNSLLWGHSTALTCRAFQLFMGKGDGKTRKPKKNKSATLGVSAVGGGPATPIAPTSSSPPPPRRVSSNINVPVRQQIMMAQLNKQLQRSAAASSSSSSSEGGAGPSSSFRPRKLERTSYRRTWDEDEKLAKAEERKRKGQDPDWDVILSRNATLPPLLIVDGYNIIHKWSRLKKHMVKGDLARARQLLVDDLEDLASLKGWRIEVVFDGGQRRMTSPAASPAAALRNAGPSVSSTSRADRVATKSVSKHGVRVVFTGSGVEADSYIEARCNQAKNVTSGHVTKSFLVATDDQMVRMAGIGAGALCMGADRFVTELKAVRQSVAYRVEVAVAAANGHVVRPDALRRSSPSSAALNRRFGRGSVLIEDKRKRKEERKKDDDAIPDLDLKIEVDVDENGIPWWAKVPNQTHLYKR